MKKLFIICMLAFLTVMSNAQNVVISDDSTYAGTTGNAILEVHSANGNKGILVPRMSTTQREAIPTAAVDEGLIVYDTTTKSFWVWNGFNWIELSDKQTLSYNSSTGELTISNGNTVTLPQSSSGDNWGSQVVVTDGTTLTGDGTSSNPLSVNGDLTDDQTLAISGHLLSIENGNSITLPDNDNQTLSLSGNTLSISGGNSVDLSGYLDNTDNQTLSLSGTTLSISGGNNVNLSNAITSTAWSLIGNSGTSSATNFIGTTDATDVVLKANNSEQVRVLSGGAHGLGFPNGGYGIWGKNSAGSTWIRALLPANSDDNIYIGSFSNPSSTSIVFNVGGYTASSALLINGSNGYVGIGTNSPTQRLTVYGNIKDVNGAVMGSKSNGDATAMLTSDGSIKLYRNPNSSTLVSPHTCGYIDYKNDPSDDYDLRLAYNDTIGNNGAFIIYPTTNGQSSSAIPAFVVLNENGNVGIGGGVPLARLHIKGDNNEEYIRLSKGSGQPFNISFGDNLGSVSNSSGVIFFDVAGAETYVFGGHVVPSTDANRSLGDGSHRWSAVYAANGTIQTSDMNDKTSVKNLQYGLDEILKLHPITFRWKQDDLNLNDFKIGLSAQELQKILPEVVVEDKNNPNASLGVMYSDIIPVLVKAIQEQQKMIEELKKEVKELKESNR